MLYQYTQHRRVAREELKEPRDLCNFVVHLAEYHAIDFPAYCIRGYGLTCEPLTHREWQVGIHLGFNLVLWPRWWVPKRDLIDKIFPGWEERDDRQLTDLEHALETAISQLRGKLKKCCDPALEKYSFLPPCLRLVGYRLVAAPGYGFACDHF